MGAYSNKFTLHTASQTFRLTQSSTLFSQQRTRKSSCFTQCWSTRRQIFPGQQSLEEMGSLLWKSHTRDHGQLDNTHEVQQASIDNQLYSRWSTKRCCVTIAA